MGKKLSNNLIDDWQKLMSGFKSVALMVPNWKVEVTTDNHIKINGDWDIVCHFINFEYIEVTLSFKNNEIMTLRHCNKYSTTVSSVLEYIEKTGI